MSRLDCRNKREDHFAEKYGFRLAPADVTAALPLRANGYCRLTRYRPAPSF